MKYVPFAHANSLYEIEIDYFKNLGIKYLFLDLDNTLDSYRLYIPTQRAIDYISKLKCSGIEPIIISNNKGKRVSSYADALGIRFMFGAMKPFAKKINSFIKENSMNKNEIMMIGDQLITDVRAGNRAGLKVVLTEKIVKEDQWTTKFNRLFDRPLRKRLKRKGLLKEWSDDYGKN